MESEGEGSLARASGVFLLWAVPRIEGHCKSGVPPKGKPVTGSATLSPPDFRYWRIHPKVGPRFAAHSSLLCATLFPWL